MMLETGAIPVVWENDDIDLPHHISTHVPAMDGQLWSKPLFVLSSYTGRLEQEDATDRFHASLAFRREIVDRIGGWPLTKRFKSRKSLKSSPGTRPDCQTTGRWHHIFTFFPYFATLCWRARARDFKPNSRYATFENTAFRNPIAGWLAPSV